MAVKEVLLLGDPSLYQKSEEIKIGERESLKPVITDLHDTLMRFRMKYDIGRAIAAPQIGVFKRLIYLCIPSPLVFINPEIKEKSSEMITLWDDCLSFPGLLVKVRRHKTCTIRYKDLHWNECVMELDGDLSELAQHEIDHLDGILAVQRAIDNHSFALKSFPFK